MFSFLNPLPSLPQYSGPYKVGITDYEIPTSEIVSPSAVPDARINTIKFRVYYPTGNDSFAKESTYWLPDPQKQWNDAFASFLGADARWASVVSRIWSITNYIKLPVIKNAPLLRSTSGAYPVCFFSHGLGGNTNIYSSIVGSLASCGVVTIVPEHRDGSSPISFIRNAKGEIQDTIPYQKLSHSPDPKILNARNAQLRIRLWELELAYSAVKSLNDGHKFTNYADLQAKSSLDLKGLLNLQPGQVAWSGHSFGAATMTQFVKSIFYHQHLPEPKKDLEWDWTPLYQADAESDLIKQITPESPVALLDIWTMPLRSETTSWLWERPMPCYSSTNSNTTNGNSNTVAMISGEFYRYEGIFNRTRALLSMNPAQAIETIENGTELKQEKLPPTAVPDQRNIDEATSDPDPGLSRDDADTSNPSDSKPSSNLHTPLQSTPTSSQSSISIPPHSTQTEPQAESKSARGTQSQSHPQLYHIPQSAHLSQSDFGPLFPTITKYAMKSLDPHKTIELNVRAILAVMRQRGLDVRNVVTEKKGEKDWILDGDNEEHLTTEGESKETEKVLELRKKDLEKWVRVPLVEC